MSTEDSLNLLLEQHRLANEGLAKTMRDNFSTVNLRLSGLTQEIVNTRSDLHLVKTQLGNVKQDISELKDQEIDITNGDNIPVRVKRDDVIAKSYHLLKPGGHLDKKLDEINYTWADTLKNCQEKHTPGYLVGQFNKKVGPWEKSLRTIAWLLLASIVAGSLIFNHEDRTKQNKQLQDSISLKIEKNVKVQLEKLVK